MNRSETIQLIAYLNCDADADRLERLSTEELHSYVVHLKAMKLRSLNERQLAGHGGAKS